MEEMKSYFAVIPANVRYDQDLPPNAKLLYGEITALSNEKGYCWAQNSYFANLYNVSKTTVSKWIAALIGKGYINAKIVYKDGSKEIDKRYLTIINDPIVEKLNTPIEEKLKDNNTSLNNTLNNTRNKKERKSKANSFDTLIDNYIAENNETEEARELLIEWLKVRKAKRAAMTDRAIELNLNKLNGTAFESGLSVVDYLKEIILRGWAAFYPINNYAKQQAKQGSSIMDDYNRMEEILTSEGLFG